MSLTWFHVEPEGGAGFPLSSTLRTVGTAEGPCSVTRRVLDRGGIRLEQHPGCLEDATA